MPSKLGRNLRKGHLAEDIGQSVLRGFSAVADVRFQDDIGLDAYAVLLRPSNGLLHAEELFSLQFKTISIKAIEYNEESTRWFLNLNIPLFFARVDSNNGTVQFFSSTRHRRLLGINTISELVLIFDSEECSISHNKAKVGLWPPILECNELESRTDSFAQFAYNFFRSWIAFESNSIELSKLNIHLSADWSTGNEPKVNHTSTVAKLKERKERLSSAKPIIQMMAFHALGGANHDPSLLKSFIRIFEWYKEEGFDDEFDNSEVLHSQMIEWEKWKTNE